LAASATWVVLSWVSVAASVDSSSATRLVEDPRSAWGRGREGGKLAGQAGNSQAHSTHSMQLQEYEGQGFLLATQSLYSLYPLTPHTSHSLLLTLHMPHSLSTHREPRIRDLQLLLVRRHRPQLERLVPLEGLKLSQLALQVTDLKEGRLVRVVCSNS
jgi:hypothetical protein